MALFKPYPVVSFGSMGEAVLLLQKALNLGPTQLSRLAEDASFGPRPTGGWSSSRVRRMPPATAWSDR
jgi:hypothetical protein